MDTLLLILGAYLGAIDAYVCVKEDVPGKACVSGCERVSDCGVGLVWTDRLGLNG